VKKTFTNPERFSYTRQPSGAEQSLHSLEGGRMESSSPSTSLTLLERLRLRDHSDAWSRFVQLYTPLLQKWAKQQGLQEADAADLTQEVLVKLMDELPHYTRGEGQSFRGWLYRVTANQCRDFRRRVATRALPNADGLSDVDEDPQPSDFEEVDYRRSLVNRALELIRAEFKDQTWTAFEQLMIEGRSAADIARDLNTTENAVYLARHRVLTRLRREIDGFLE
jgi:RNA polymerase sigma-70 factor, ECF subfamily